VVLLDRIKHFNFQNDEGSGRSSEEAPGPGSIRVMTTEKSGEEHKELPTDKPLFGFDSQPERGDLPDKAETQPPRESKLDS